MWAELAGLSDWSDMFRLRPLGDIVVDYAQPMWVPLAPLVEKTLDSDRKEEIWTADRRLVWNVYRQFQPLTAAMVQSLTWGELCTTVPIGTIGLLTLPPHAERIWRQLTDGCIEENPRIQFKREKLVFVVAGKPENASNGVLNVVFLPLQRCKHLYQSLGRGPRHLTDLASNLVVRVEDIWGDSKMPVHYTPPNSMGEEVKSINVGPLAAPWIRFIDPTEFVNHFGGFWGYLSQYAPQDVLLWKTSILAELDQQQNSRPK